MSPALAKALRAARDTRSLEIGAQAATQTARIFRDQFGSRQAVIVADSNTNRV